MINRATLNRLAEDLMCAAILLSLCVLIILGPQRQSFESTASAQAEDSGAAAVEALRLFEPSEIKKPTILKTSHP